MRNALPLVITLSIIAMVSGAVLAYVYQATTPAIAQQKELALKQAILEVVPGANSFIELSTTETAAASTGQPSAANGARVFEASKASGDRAGLAVLAEGPGFQGMIKLMIGVDPNSGTITGLKVLEQLETPGLGARIAEEWFQDQFRGKSIDDQFLVKQDVDAITGATISSRAVATIVKDTLQNLKPILTKEAR